MSIQSSNFNEKTIKIYKDEELIDRVEDLHLGIVEAGHIKKFIFWVRNDSKAVLKELKFNIDHNEISILKSPIDMESQEVAELVIEWSPLITLKEPLKTKIQIHAIELYYP